MRSLNSHAAAASLAPNRWMELHQRRLALLFASSDSRVSGAIRFSLGKWSKGG